MNQRLCDDHCYHQKTEQTERYFVMASKETTGPTAAKAGTPPFFLNWGQDRTEAAMGLQKAILESYEQATAPG
jgi:hypothetical protein